MITVTWERFTIARDFLVQWRNNLPEGYTPPDTELIDELLYMSDSDEPEYNIGFTWAPIAMMHYARKYMTPIDPRLLGDVEWPARDRVLRAIVSVRVNNTEWDDDQKQGVFMDEIGHLPDHLLQKEYELDKDAIDEMLEIMEQEGT